MRARQYSLPLGAPYPGREFEEEIAHDYEAGLKGAFFDRTLRVKPSVFPQRFDHYQVELLNPLGLGFIIGSDASVEAKGAAFEFQWLATERLTIDGSAAYVSARFDPGCARCGATSACSAST